MVENMNNEAFLIKETNGEARMKNISPISLPHFHGLTIKDPNTFMFEYFVVCRTYGNAFDDQRLKLFLSTLKDATLCWFIGLPGDNITTWTQMKQAFNGEYMDYCRSKETKEEIFRITLVLDESLEDYKERFQLSYKRARCTLDPKSPKLVLLQGIRKDILETLNMLPRDISISYPMMTLKLCSIITLGMLERRVGLVKAWPISLLLQHPSRMRLGTCWRTLKVKCYIPLLCKWMPCKSRGNKRKQREP